MEPATGEGRPPLVLKGRDGTSLVFEQSGEDLTITLCEGHIGVALRSVYFFRDGNLYGPELLNQWLTNGGDAE